MKRIHDSKGLTVLSYSDRGATRHMVVSSELADKLLGTDNQWWLLGHAKQKGVRYAGACIRWIESQPMNGN